MEQQSNVQNKFLIDAEIGDDDVTLPNLPAIDVPIVESPAKSQENIEVAKDEVASTETPVEQPKLVFGRMKEGLTKTRRNFADGMVNILIGGKEIDDELLEEVEEQLLVADIGVEATKPSLPI